MTLGRVQRPPVSVFALALAVSGLPIALPPPLCRGRVVGRYDPKQNRAPSARALAEIQAAYDALCPLKNCGNGNLYENPTIGNNAATWVSGVGQGKQTTVQIVYSKRFLNALNDSFGPGASFGVLAHEVGHHLTAALGMRAKGESNWNEELRADYMAGCALGRAGRTPHELENALRALASVKTASHPSFAQRVPVVRRGFQECRTQADKAAELRQPFGLGRLLNDKESAGCWRYWYRLRADVSTVGPVAAARRRTRGFADEAGCEAHRNRMTEAGTRVTEACRCAK